MKNAISFFSRYAKFGVRSLSRLASCSVLITLAGCRLSSTTELYWYEEALQDDGSIVLVKKFEAGYSATRKEPGANTYGYHPTKLEVADPKTGKPVLWNPRGLPPLMPYALHVHQKVLYVFAMPYLRDGHSDFGCQRPPYIVFRWDGNYWKRIGLSDLPTRFKRHNLLDAAGNYLWEDDVQFKITSGRIVKASTIEIEVRAMSGNPRAFKPLPSDFYEREIQYADRGPYYECAVYNRATKYDGVEIK